MLYSFHQSMTSAMSRQASGFLRSTPHYNIFYAFPIHVIVIPLVLHFGKYGLLLPLNLILPGLCFLFAQKAPLIPSVSYWNIAP